MAARFTDRTEAGRVLAARLEDYAHNPDVIVLALPRGGVPVGFEIARSLGAPLDVLLAGKLGLPGHEELAFGAIATGGVRVLSQETIETFAVSAEMIESATRREREGLERREQEYRGRRTPLDVGGKIAILVDDGLATGSTMRAAVIALRRKQPARVVAAVPVGAADTCGELRREVDEIVCEETPEPFGSVGEWYEDFRPVTDEQIRALLGTGTPVRPAARRSGA